MTYMNLVLQFLGYRIYEGQLRAESTGEIYNSILIVKSDIALMAETVIVGSRKEDFVFIMGYENQE